MVRSQMATQLCVCIGMALDVELTRFSDGIQSAIQNIYTQIQRCMCYTVIRLNLVWLFLESIGYRHVRVIRFTFI